MVGWLQVDTQDSNEWSSLRERDETMISNNVVTVFIDCWFQLTNTFWHDVQWELTVM